VRDFANLSLVDGLAFFQAGWKWHRSWTKASEGYVKAIEDLYIYIKRIEFNGIYRYILRYHFRFNSWNKLYADLNPNGLGLSIGLSAQLAAGGSQTIDLICYTDSWSLMVVSERSE